MNTGAAALERSRALPCEPLNVTPTTAGHLLGIGRTTVHELIKDGTLESVWLGNRRLVRYASVRAYSESLSSERPAKSAA